MPLCAHKQIPHGLPDCSQADTLRQSLAAFKAFKEAETEGPEGPQPDQDKQVAA